MKNFFKKLSFVLAIAMVLTSIAPATASAAEVVPAKKVNVKVDGEKVDTINLTVGETETVKIGLPVKKAYAGQKSTFKTAAVAEGTAVEVVRVGNRTYELTAVEAGEATITFGAAKTKKLANAGEFKVSKEVKVVVEDGFAMTDVTAKKVNKLEVTFAAPVDTDKVALTVNKGANAVDHKVEWNAEKTVATITTTAKMTVGTYTVKATAEDATAEKSVEIENQYVKDIVILNDTALTGQKDVDGDTKLDDAGEVYVYYKVVDQYDEDLTASTSIQWNTSCGTPKVDRAEGKLTLSRSDKRAFTYGEQIFVTGVYTKTGKSAQATLTVGSAQSLHSIEMVGFVKKNTSTIVETLPNGFRTKEYYLLYDAVDQNGNVLSARAYNDKNHITFVTDNVLVVKEVDTTSFTTMVINGHEYRAVLIVPGEYVDKGGEVNFTAIATKTGNDSVKNYVVGQNQILDSFTLSAPTSVVADGEKVEIPFTALDTNGNAITNFTTLADNLNELNFNVSEGSLTLYEKADGTAALIYQDKACNDWPSYTTDSIDRIVSLTAIVVGGQSDTLLLSISDKARPDAIYSVSLNSAYVEADSDVIYMFNPAKKNTFTFLDQYGRVMLDPWGNPTDNGFFAAAYDGGLTGIDFDGYRYNITMEYKGSEKALDKNAGIASVADQKIQIFTDGAAIGVNAKATFTADKKTNTAITGNMFTFAISKKDLDKANAEYENVSTTFNHTFAVVDLSQVKNFAVGNLNKQFIETAATNATTGELAGITSDVITATVSAIVVNGDNSALDIANDYTQPVKVTGSYNGVSVKIPAIYYSVTADKLVVSGATITGVADGAIRWSDLYDATTAKYLRKDTVDTLKVTLYNVFSNDAATMGNNVGQTADSLRDVISKVVTISDARPVLTAVLADDTAKTNPTDTLVIAAPILACNHPYYFCRFYDQYGVTLDHDQYIDVNTDPEAAPNFQQFLGADVSVTYRISKIEEANGFAENNFTVSSNESLTTSATGAERGDTFVLTITARDKYYTDVVVTKDVVVTVEADNYAFMNQNVNKYVDDLKDTLDTQRENTLN